MHVGGFIILVVLVILVVVSVRDIKLRDTCVASGNNSVCVRRRADAV